MAGLNFWRTATETANVAPLARSPTARTAFFAPSRRKRRTSAPSDGRKTSVVRMSAPSHWMEVLESGMLSYRRKT